MSGGNNKYEDIHFVRWLYQEVISGYHRDRHWFRGDIKVPYGQAMDQGVVVKYYNDIHCARR